MKREQRYWQVSFKYERDGFAGSMIVLARQPWRAKMAAKKKLHRLGWTRACGFDQDAKPAPTPKNKTREEPTR